MHSVQALRLRSTPTLVASFCGLLLLAWFGQSLAAAQLELNEKAASLLRKYCFDCHGDGAAEGHVDLDQMLAATTMADDFRTWERLAEVLGQAKMPPADTSQPTDAERRHLIQAVTETLSEVAHQRSGDPGRVLLRRLTSAEYTYTIEDLTGLRLALENELGRDAVGGEGFTNTGLAQFIQDSTLERYLQVAKRVASHAVIGTGPLQFYRDPGQTGLELSAINRINKIYRTHGFRTGAGEGGKPFGLDRYPKAFYVAWRFMHRESLELSDKSLAQLVAEEQPLDVRFVRYLWSVLNDSSPSFPTSDVVDAWHALPTPTRPDERIEAEAREACQKVYERLREWQRRLATSAGAQEEAALLDESALHVVGQHEFEVSAGSVESTTHATVSVDVLPLSPGTQTIIRWRDARVQFRGPDRVWRGEQSLSELLDADARERLKLGIHPSGGDARPTDFYTRGATTLTFKVALREEDRDARVVVAIQLDPESQADGLVRCELSTEDRRGTRRSQAVMLSDPLHRDFPIWKEGVVDLARSLPDLSHREPAPSDRDPIPAPFDNGYNNTERDHFHYKIKYHRDDRFLVDHILNDRMREKLDNAWYDLLGSFDYHDTWLSFLERKFDLNLQRRRISQLDDQFVARLPEEPRRYLEHYRNEYKVIQQALRAAEPGHVEDVLGFAHRAWRRPLEPAEEDRLRSYYTSLRNDAGLDHAPAIRTMLARVLVAPSFLYRVESPAAETGAAPLSDWQLASRLSYFLWSSVPDVELRRAAAAGELQDEENLRRQARRMLRDPKARRFATEFFGQWFGFYRFDEYRGVDADRFPEFTEELRASMYGEAIAFFEHIVRHDRPVREILFADYAFLDQRLRRFYGVAADLTSPDQGWQRVANVTSANRGGLLGLGAVLTVTSAPLRTSPVKRGDWVLRRVIGTPVPPPPPDAGSIPADDVLPDGLTTRQRLEAHRQDPKCMGCHSRIDPLGFALENFDAVGRWRDNYQGGQTIDAATTLADGTEIAGLAGLQRFLAKNQREFHRTLCTKLLGYALGRSETIADLELVDQMLDELAAESPLSKLIEQIVTSRQFRWRRGQDDAFRHTAAGTSGRNR